MYNSKHSKFILTPIIGILKDMVNACSGIGDGIETQPLSEYILQTTFLKMTGASEQKLKCIVWELATYDYDYRYSMLSNPYGECSCYDEKKNVFGDLLKVIKHIDGNYDFDNLFNDKNIKIYQIHKDIVSIIQNSKIEIWANRTFNFFNNKPTKIIETLFLNRNNAPNAKLPYNFFEKDLKDYYENVVYRSRNKCAHNLKSYQENLPTLKTLSEREYEYENYFSMFEVLILMDDIYMELYKEFQRVLQYANE